MWNRTIEWIILLINMDNSALCYSDASFLDHTLSPIEERAGRKVKQRAPLSLLVSFLLFYAAGAGDSTLDDQNPVNRI